MDDRTAWNIGGERPSAGCCPGVATGDENNRHTGTVCS